MKLKLKCYQECLYSAYCKTSNEIIENFKKPCKHWDKYDKALFKALSKSTKQDITLLTIKYDFSSVFYYIDDLIMKYHIPKNIVYKWVISKLKNRGA